MRRGIGKLLVAVAVVFVTLAAGELAARVFLPASAPIRFAQVQDNVDLTLRARYGNQGQTDAPPPTLSAEELFVSDPELFWRFAPDLRTTDDFRPIFGLISNGQGLREDHEISPEKRPGEIRLLFLGDSSGFGFLLPHDEAIAHLVELEIARRLPDLDVECINAGVPGYTLFQGWRFLDTVAERYRPDLVVVDFGRNAPGIWDARGDREHYRSLRASEPIAALRWSRLARWIQGALARSGAPAGGENRPRLKPKEFEEVLGEMRDTCERIGTDLLLLVGAVRINVAKDLERRERTLYQERMRSFGTRLRFGPDGGPGFVDAVPVARDLAEERPLKELFFDPAHPTAATNRAVARVLVDKLEPWLRAK